MRCSYLERIPGWGKWVWLAGLGQAAGTTFRLPWLGTTKASHLCPCQSQVGKGIAAHQMFSGELRMTEQLTSPTWLVATPEGKEHSEASLLASTLWPREDTCPFPSPSMTHDYSWGLPEHRGSSTRGEEELEITVQCLG